MHTAAGVAHADFRVPQMHYVTLLRLTLFMTRDAREVLQAFERCVFDVVFDNRDDHAKNLFFVMDADGRWQFPPAYDLTFNSGPGGEHQMDVCGEARAVTREHLMKLASKTGIAPRVAAPSIDRIAAIASDFKRYADHLPITVETLDAMTKRISTNQVRVASRLWTTLSTARLFVCWRFLDNFALTRKHRKLSQLPSANALAIPDLLKRQLVDRKSTTVLIH